LFDLFVHGYLPEHAVIVGYARSHKTSEEFAEHLRPYLHKTGLGGAEKIDEFLRKCTYMYVTLNRNLIYLT
jgi:glucose-6-phosphate 1-dehydrogenase